MSDPQPNLEEILEELREALEAADDLDDEARDRLRNAAREIQQTVGVEREGADDDQSMLDRLNEAIESLEAKHPNLTAIVGRVADALSDLGI